VFLSPIPNSCWLYSLHPLRCLLVNHHPFWHVHFCFMTFDLKQVAPSLVLKAAVQNPLQFFSNWGKSYSTQRMAQHVPGKSQLTGTTVVFIAPVLADVDDCIYFLHFVSVSTLLFLLRPSCVYRDHFLSSYIGMWKSRSDPHFCLNTPTHTHS
jgi:hypothetical protein